MDLFFFLFNTINATVVLHRLINKITIVDEKTALLFRMTSRQKSEGKVVSMKEIDLLSRTRKT
jgi:hypothetical protein